MNSLNEISTMKNNSQLSYSDIIRISSLKPHYFTTSYEISDKTNIHEADGMVNYQKKTHCSMEFFFDRFATGSQLKLEKLFHRDWFATIKSNSFIFLASSLLWLEINYHDCDPEETQVISKDISENHLIKFFKSLKSFSKLKTFIFVCREKFKDSGMERPDNSSIRHLFESISFMNDLENLHFNGKVVSNFDGNTLVLFNYYRRRSSRKLKFVHLEFDSACWDSEEYSRLISVEKNVEKLSFTCQVDEQNVNEFAGRFSKHTHLRELSFRNMIFVNEASSLNKFKTLFEKLSNCKSLEKIILSHFEVNCKLNEAEILKFSDEIKNLSIRIEFEQLKCWNFSTERTRGLNKLEFFYPNNLKNLGNTISLPFSFYPELESIDGEFVVHVGFDMKAHGTLWISSLATNLMRLERITKLKIYFINIKTIEEEEKNWAIVINRILKSLNSLRELKFFYTYNSAPEYAFAKFDPFKFLDFDEEWTMELKDHPGERILEVHR